MIRTSSISTMTSQDKVPVTWLVKCLLISRHLSDFNGSESYKSSKLMTSYITNSISLESTFTDSVPMEILIWSFSHSQEMDDIHKASIATQSDEGDFWAAHTHQFKFELDHQTKTWYIVAHLKQTKKSNPAHLDHLNVLAEALSPAWDPKNCANAGITSLMLVESRHITQLLLNSNLHVDWQWLLGSFYIWNSSSSS